MDRKDGRGEGRQGRGGIEAHQVKLYVSLSLRVSYSETMAYISYTYLCLMVLPLAILLVTAAPTEKEVTECEGGHKVNETWVTGKVCAEYLCLPDGSISATPCFPMQVGPRCKRVEADRSASFPECCDRVECVSDGEKHTKKEDKYEEKKKKDEKN